MTRFSRYIARLALPALLALPVAMPAAAQGVQVAAISGNPLIFKGKAPTAELTADRRELLLRFPQPIDAALGDTLPQLYPDLVDYVSTGYDQILIRGKRPLAFSLTPEGAAGNRLVLTAAPAGPAAAAAPGEAPPDLLRRLTLVRIEIQRGQIGQATMDLDTLTSRYGERPEILAARAELAETRGAWRQAAENFRRAGALDAGNEYYADAAQRTGQQGAPLARVDTDIAKVKHADRQVITVGRVQTGIGKMTDAGAILENRRLDTDTALNLDGTSSPAHLERQRAEVYVSHSFDTGGTLRLAALADSAGTPGAAVSYAWRDARQETRIGTTYHRAYWELVSGILHDATQDSVELQHEHQFGDGWSGTLGVRYNRYGIAGDEDVARSGGLTGGLRKAFTLGDIDMSAGYSFDGEYMDKQTSYRAADGTMFRPLDIGTREIHSLDVTLADNLTDWLRMDLYGGYAYDRYNEGGPILGGSLALIGQQHFEAGLRASHAKALTRGSGDDVTRAGAYAQWRF
jgi:hypothetical protein